MGQKYRNFKHHCHRPTIWWKLRAMCVQILVPLICFQFIRTLLLPTTFDIILLTLMIALYFSLRFRIF